MGRGLVNTQWDGEWCKRCNRRNVLGFNVDDWVWLDVVKKQYSILCITCFDELAEDQQVKYKYTNVYPVTWSDWQY